MNCPRCGGLVDFEDVVLPEAFPIKDRIFHCLICGWEDSNEMRVNRMFHDFTVKEKKERTRR
jgi:hypothetical protein